MGYRDRVTASATLTTRFKRFFVHLGDYTNMDAADLDEIMHGAFVVVPDGGRFYRLMCHDMLLCERKRMRNTDQECNTCTDVHKVYYEKASFGNGSSHRAWRDDDFPQYRMGKAVLPNLGTGGGFSPTFDFLIGLRMEDNGSVCSWFQFEAQRGQDTVHSRQDLVQLDSESGLTKTLKMSTLGHIGSTLSYALSRRNQGPFGTSAHNDAQPLRLELTGSVGANRYFSPITETDSVHFAGSTDCRGGTQARPATPRA